MTVIRNLVFVLLCSLTTSGVFADVVSEWQCEANDETISLIVADDFHAEVLSTNAYSLTVETSPALRGSADNPFIMVAETLWQSLWSTDDVILEVMSETAIKLILASGSSDSSDAETLTCTVNPESDA